MHGDPHNPLILWFHCRGLRLVILARLQISDAANDHVVTVAVSGLGVLAVVVVVFKVQEVLKGVCSSNMFSLVLNTACFENHLPSAEEQSNGKINAINASVVSLGNIVTNLHYAVDFSQAQRFFEI